eukprot:gene8055-8883_t
MVTSVGLSRSVESIIQRLKLGEYRHVAVLTGAGISCAAGIPDFRSPGGMYDTLRPDLLSATEQERRWMRTEPTAVVDFDLFRRNQFPYLEVRRPFILGTAEQQWKATLSHYFMKVLHDKGMLQRVYTQNIDGLDLQLSLPRERIVNVHGSLAEVQCEFCATPYPMNEFVDEVRTKIKNIYDDSDEQAPKSSSAILCKRCHRPGVKPATVMFGRNLPPQVWRSIEDDFPQQIDLLIIAGTSLVVSPACNLVNKVAAHVPRLLVNLELVGGNLGLDFGAPIEFSSDLTDPRDACILGPCDEGFLYIAERLGWLEELREYSDRMCESSKTLLVRK